MAYHDDFPELTLLSVDEWREWLSQQHAKATGVWLVFHKKSSPTQGLRYPEAVDEALCWGWIDSLTQRIDEFRYRQVFTPRKPRSEWSGLNKRKVAGLMAGGRMQPVGLAAIEVAKANGAWTAMDAVEAHQLPDDLEAAFAAAPRARACFEGLAPSKRKMILHWLRAAKRDATREARVRSIVESLAEGYMPGPLARND